MANTVANLTAVLQMNNSKFKKGLTGSQKALNGFQKQLKAVGGMVAGAFAVGAIVNFGREAVKLASQAEGVQAAFEKLNNPHLLDDLRAATRGTVSDLELMKQAVRAKNFKIPLEQLATFFEFATNRSIETGESVDYLVNSIIDGIGRKSSLVMDNLGISATELQAEIKKVGDFGQASANIIAREMEKAGTVLDTTAIDLARVTTAWENLKVTIGSKAIGAASGGLEYIEAFKQLMTNSNLSVIDKIKISLLGQKGAMQDLAEEWRIYYAEIEKANEISAEFAGALDRVVESGIDWAQVNKDIFDAWVKENDIIKAQIKLQEDLKVALDESTHAMNAQITAMGAQFENPYANRPGDGLTDNEYLYQDDMEEILEDPQTEQATTDYWDKMAKSVKDGSSALRDAHEQSMRLANDVTRLTSGFMGLGTAIAQLAGNATESFEDTAQTLMQSVGSVLTSLGGWAALVGIILQGGSAIWDALESPDSGVVPNNAQWGTASVKLTVQGRDLVGAIENENAYRGVTR